MFCRNCGAQVDDQAQFCIRCGASLKEPESAMPPPPPGDVPPPAYGDAPPPPPYGDVPPPPPPPLGATPWTGTEPPKQKLVAALLGIFLGVLGIHRFYLGYNTIGAVQLALGLLGIFTCGGTSIVSWVWGIVDGVMILTGSLRTDAKGIPLRD